MVDTNVLKPMLAITVDKMHFSVLPGGSNGMRNINFFACTFTVSVLMEMNCPPHKDFNMRTIWHI
ncbi:hypothetical protein XC93_25240 [Klebsiella variicola]|nr:hypothetical protein [Klebsiella variicola]MDT7028319.1 hypothetical protein [Klebsiella variicola]